MFISWPFLLSSIFEEVQLFSQNSSLHLVTSLQSIMDPQISRSPFLALPREIRDQIIGEVIFPSEKEPVSFNQDAFGRANTAKRQILPYARSNRPKYDVAIIRTCRQLQSEAEYILYGTSSFNLTYYDSESCWNFWNFRYLSYQFLEDRPKRHRRLIQRVERRCYSGVNDHNIEMFD